MDMQRENPNSARWPNKHATVHHSSKLLPVFAWEVVFAWDVASLTEVAAELLLWNKSVSNCVARQPNNRKVQPNNRKVKPEQYFAIKAARTCHKDAKATGVSLQ